MPASKNGKLVDVQYILNQGVDVNTMDYHGKTALMWASSQGHIDIVKELLERNVDVNVQDIFKLDTALMLINKITTQE